MELDLNDVAALMSACERDLGNPDDWHNPSGYPDSLALCVIDSIYSTGAKYSSVVNVVNRYRAHRAEAGGDADTDGLNELIASIDALGGADGWATQIGNRRPTSTAANAPLKSVAIRQVAASLVELGISTTAELHASNQADALTNLESAWRAAPGQRSGITWDYALMLARIPGVKADRMVIAYVARAIGTVSNRLAPSTVAALVSEVAQLKGWDVIRLDHAIWRFESKRPPFDQVPPEAQQEKN